jgi:hypothetical protein
MSRGRTFGCSRRSLKLSPPRCLLLGPLPRQMINCWGTHYWMRVRTDGRDAARCQRWQLRSVRSPFVVLYHQLTDYHTVLESLRLSQMLLFRPIHAANLESLLRIFGAKSSASRRMLVAGSWKSVMTTVTEPSLRPSSNPFEGWDHRTPIMGPALDLETTVQSSVPTNDCAYLLLELRPTLKSHLLDGTGSQVATGLICESIFLLFP